MSLLSKMKTLLPILLLAVVALCVSEARAQEELKLGKPMPPMPEGVWVGEAADTQGEQVKMLLFWEPTRTESRLAFPILSQLQQRWGTDRLSVIGIGVEQLEDDQKPYVKPWIIRQSTRIKFPVVIVQRNKLNRAWRKNLTPPYFFMVIVSADNTVQAIVNPLSSEVNRLIARLIGGRYDINAMDQGKLYLEQLERYQLSRDWRQYALVMDRLNSISQKVYADQELDFIVSMLTEQDNYDEGLARINASITDRAAVDPDYLGMLAERLATDPTIPDDRRPLEIAEKAARESLIAAGTSEAKSRAMIRHAEVVYKQGKTAAAIAEAKQAYRIAPPNVKSDFKERWVDMKRRALADGRTAAGA